HRVSGASAPTAQHAQARSKPPLLNWAPWFCTSPACGSLCLSFRLSSSVFICVHLCLSVANPAASPRRASSESRWGGRKKGGQFPSLGGVVMWSNTPETQELLEQARQGDAGAVERLLTTHREPLRRMIGLRLDPALAARVDASDIVQDVLLEAHRRL